MEEIILDRSPQLVHQGEHESSFHQTASVPMLDYIDSRHQHLGKLHHRWQCLDVGKEHRHPFLRPHPQSHPPQALLHHRNSVNDVDHATLSDVARYSDELADGPQTDKHDPHVLLGGIIHFLS